MAGELWNRMIATPDDATTAAALGQVRERAGLRRVAAARRRRTLAIAAALALTFAAGWMVGQASPGTAARWVWGLRGHSIEESRATFVAVPASDE